MRFLLVYISFYICFCITGCSKNESQPTIKIKWSKQIDSLLHTDSSSGMVADSLKKEFFKAKTDEDAIDILNDIAYHWKGPQIKYFALETQRLSKKIGYDYGFIDGLNKFGYYHYWMYNDDSARFYYESALELALAKNYSDLQANILCDIGDLHRVHFEHKSALEYYDRSLKLASKINNKHLVSRLYSVMADVNRLIGKSNEAKKLYEKSLRIAKEIRDYQRMAFCYAYMGDLDRLEANYTASLRQYNLALLLGKKANDLNTVCNSYCNMGELYRFLFDHEKSIENLKLGLEIAIKLNDKTNVCFAHAGLGSNYRQLKKIKLARYHFRELLRVSTEANEKSSIINSGINLAETYIDYLETLDTAKMLIENSLIMAEKIGFLHGLARGNYLLGQISFLKKNYPEAIVYGLKAKKYSNNTKTSTDLIDISWLLCRAYEKVGQLQASLDMFKLNMNTRDSVMNEEQIRKFSATEFEGKETALKIKQLERDKKHKIEQAKKEEEIKRQRFVRNAFIIGFALIGLFSVLLFRSLRQNKKQKEIIQHQKEEVEEKQKEVMDSIRYAQRIQKALLPSQKYIERVLKKLK